MVLVASSRATALILELAGGEAEPAATIAGNLTKAAKPVCLRHARVRSLLGLELPDDAIRECLRRAGLAELAPSAAGSSTWIAPSFRIDLTREVDLIEEVARFTGIAAIPSRVVSFPVPATRTDRDFDLASELRAKLVHAGFFEARTSTLVSETALGDDACNALRLKNPIGAEQSCLRPSLIPALLNCARANFHAGAKSVRLFEIGNRFSSTPPEQLPVLALFASGESVPVHWQSPAPAPIDFFAFAGVIQSLFPTPPSFVPSPAPGFAARVEIRFKGTKIGWAGLLNPSRARELDAPADCLTAEIELPTLFDALAKPTKGISPLLKFPPVTRDLAIVLDASTPYAEIERTIQASAGSYLVGLVPFDVFTDPAGIKLPPNKKSIAVSLTFQSKERTLEHSEIDAALSALRKQLESQLGASFRE
jgi:phenylalanyl-tRNA synthetase beta chain